MRPSSDDLRERIADALNAGDMPRDITQRYRLSIRTVERYRQRLATTGDLTPGRSPGRHRTLQPDHEVVLETYLRAHRAATLAELQHHLAAASDVVVHRATIGRTLHRLGWSRKKAQWQPGSRIQLPELPGGATPSIPT